MPVAGGMLLSRGVGMETTVLASPRTEPAPGLDRALCESDCRCCILSVVDDINDGEEGQRLRYVM